MPLGLTDAQKNYSGPTFWAATVYDADGVPHYFAEDVIFPASLSPFLPYLRIDQGPQKSRDMSSDYAQISLVNADLFASGLMTAADFEGCLCILYEYLVGLSIDAGPPSNPAFIERFRGVLTESAQADSGVSWRVVAEMDASQIDAQPRLYSEGCMLRFAMPICGYAAATSTITQVQAEMTADTFSSTTIGLSTFTITAAVVGCYVVITGGTGQGQKRRIASNSSTVLTVVNPFATTPDATSKFAVYDFGDTGAPMGLFTAAGSTVYDATPDISGADQMGYSGLNLTAGAYVGATLVWIDALGNVLGTASIVSNTATTLTYDPDSVTGTILGIDRFRVIFATCPKDFGQSCEMRARAHRFTGFPTLASSNLDVLSDSSSSTLATIADYDATYNGGM